MKQFSEGKRLFAVILTAAMLTAALCGCGEENTTSTSSAADDTSVTASTEESSEQEGSTAESSVEESSEAESSEEESSGVESSVEESSEEESSEDVSEEVSMTSDEVLASIPVYEGLGMYFDESEIVCYGHALVDIPIDYGGKFVIPAGSLISIGGKLERDGYVLVILADNVGFDAPISDIEFLPLSYLKTSGEELFDYVSLFNS